MEAVKPGPWVVHSKRHAQTWTVSRTVGHDCEWLENAKGRPVRFRSEAAAIRAADLANGQRGDTTMTTGKSTPLQDLGARPGVQDLDPAGAERLHQLRQTLGLSVTDMAQRLGLWGTNGADNLRQMERCVRPMPGTVRQLVAAIEREQQLEAALQGLVRHVGIVAMYQDLPELNAARKALRGE